MVATAVTSRHLLSAEEITDLRIEADVVRSLLVLRKDRVDAVDRLLAPCFARREPLRPFVVSSAANIATVVAAYRGDLDEVHRLQGWAVPFFQRSIGKHNVILGLCFTGLAAGMQLDLVEAEACYRKALKLAKQAGGSHSYTARLASSLLGELLYERGDLDEAERLLDEGNQLGPERGPMDFKIARYVTGARVKALRGDRDGAIRRPRSRPSRHNARSWERCVTSSTAGHTWSPPSRNCTRISRPADGVRNVPKYPLISSSDSSTPRQFNGFDHVVAGKVHDWRGQRYRGGDLAAVA